MPTFMTMHTPNGHVIGEVTSALQKSIRRNLEADALYWASELDLAGFGAYVWKRLRIIASEDVGVADSNVALIVRALNDNWVEQRKANSDTQKEAKMGPDRLFLMHAIILLCRAPKSRMVDHAAMVTYQGERAVRDMPDWALDKHTARGRKLGRGVDHFFDEGAVLSPRSPLKDPYEKAARKAHTLFLAAGGLRARATAARTNGRRKPSAYVERTKATRAKVTRARR